MSAEIVRGRFPPPKGSKGTALQQPAPKQPATPAPGDDIHLMEKARLVVELAKIYGVSLKLCAALADGVVK